MVTFVEAGEPTALGLATLDAVLADRLTLGLMARFNPSTLTERVGRDQALLAASGRWRAGRDDPERFVPGDAPIIRGIPALALMREWATTLAPGIPAHGPWVGLDLHADVLAAKIAGMYMAVPHWLDETATMGILDSAPPDPSVIDGLRLPFPAVMIVFGRELPIPFHEGAWPDHWAQPQTVDARHATFPTSLETALLARGGALSGVVLFSNDDGVGLADLVLWLISANPDPDHPVMQMRRDRQRSVMIAYRSLMQWRHLVDNLAASAAWMDWREPAGLQLPAPTDPTWRKAVRTSQFRKREPGGAVAGVRVVDIRPARTATPADRRDTSRNSPVPHLRRGHWRPVRKATRDEHGNIIGDVHAPADTGQWHYEGVWIPPTAVASSGRTDPTTVVYRLPVRPPKAP